MLLLRSIRRPQRPLQPLPPALHSAGAVGIWGVHSATVGSDDIIDNNFFPDLGNLFLNNMGDNLNANGAAPVAPYVVLSCLYEIMVEFMFLLCILLLC